MCHNKAVLFHEIIKWLQKGHLSGVSADSSAHLLLLEDVSGNRVVSHCSLPWTQSRQHYQHALLYTCAPVAHPHTTPFAAQPC